MAIDVVVNDIFAQPGLVPVADPIGEVFRWYGDAVAAKLAQPEAMSLATATPEGRPSVRIVLYKPGADAIRFFTNYESHKGRSLAANPQVAATFFWEPLGRQVRVEGTVTKVSTADSDAYFSTRPRESQLGAWASIQSHELSDRHQLEGAYAAAEARWSGRAVERPPHWGGYQIAPDLIEFWLARPFRLHDRLVYRRPHGQGAWTVSRLSP